MKRSFPIDPLRFSISRLAAAHRGEPGFFDNFRALSRQLDGVEDIRVVTGPDTDRKTRPGKVFASAPVRAMNEIVGELQVYIRVEAFEDASPLPLTAFLAKQLGIAVQAAALNQSNESLRRHRALLEAEIEEHKLMERACGVMATQRLIPAGEAGRLLKKVSEQSGRNVRQLAEGIVSTANKNPWKFRREFWA